MQYMHTTTHWKLHKPSHGLTEWYGIGHARSEFEGHNPERGDKEKDGSL